MQFNTYAPYRKNAPKPSPKASQVIEKQPQEILEDLVDIFVDFKRLISGSPQISRLQKLKNELAEAIKTTNKIARKCNGKNLPRLITPQHKLLRAKDKIEPRIMFVKSSTKNKWSKKKQASKAPKKPIDLGKDNKHDSKSPSSNNTTPNNDIVNQSNDNIKPENDSASMNTNTEENEFFCTPEEQPFISSLESAPLTLIDSIPEENGPIDEGLEQLEILDNSECSFNDSSTYIDSSDVSSGCYDFSIDTILAIEPPMPVKTARNIHEVLEDPIDIFVDFQKLVSGSFKTSRSQKTKNDLSNVHPSRQKNIKVKSKKLPKLITPQHKLMRVKNRPEPKIMSLKSLIKIRGLKKSACIVREKSVEMGEPVTTDDTNSWLSQTNSMLTISHTEDTDHSASFYEDDSSSDFGSSIELISNTDSVNEPSKHQEPVVELEDTTTGSLQWYKSISVPYVAFGLESYSAPDAFFDNEGYSENDEYEDELEEYEEEYDFLYSYRRKHH